MQSVCVRACLCKMGVGEIIKLSGPWAEGCRYCRYNSLGLWIGLLCRIPTGKPPKQLAGPGLSVSLQSYGCAWQKVVRFVQSLSLLCSDIAHDFLLLVCFLAVFMCIWVFLRVVHVYGVLCMLCDWCAESSAVSSAAICLYNLILLLFLSLFQRPQ